MIDLLVFVVSVATWLTPMPQLAEGWIIRYGPDYLGRANADYHGYTLNGYECAGALMSPGDLGKVFWIKNGYDWVGPCLSVDVSRRTDFYHYVYVDEEIAELTDSTLAILGITNGARGQVYVGVCPPLKTRMPQRYAPPLVLDYPPLESHPIWKFYPEQQLPESCP